MREGNIAVLLFIAITSSTATNTCFQKQYALHNFIQAAKLENVSDVTINHIGRHILVLQRSHPPVSVWNTNGTLLFTWDTLELGYPHSLSLNTSDGTSEPTVWITDMAGAGEQLAGKGFGHCIKQFTYYGKFIGSIGNCGVSTNGSSLNPLEFDKVTDLAINSEGYIYISDGDIGGANNRVIVLDPLYNLVEVWNKENKPGSKPLQFNLPHSIEIDWCDRVWITDTLNHRIQIVSSNGRFLGEWSCFGNSLVYGIDLNQDFGIVAITTKSISGEAEIILFSVQMNDCSQLASFGSCSINRRFVLKKDMWLTQISVNAMLHSVAIENVSGDLYFYAAMLPGKIPPLKFSPAPLPPKSNLTACYGRVSPNPWPRVWSATVLLTPFYAQDLHTARVEYNTNLHAMFVQLYGPNSNGIKEYLNVKDETYILIRNSTAVSCSGPYQYGWITPPRNWLDSYKCQCKGVLNISSIEVLAWTCSMHSLRDWYWFHRNNGSLWRVLFNNQSNPTNLPVIGGYTMAHFTSYGNEASQLEAMYAICIKGSKINYFNSFPVLANPVNGFAYSSCSKYSKLPNWPNSFHLTVTMIPVILNNGNPLPTQVIYDWDRIAQRTIMCEALQTYNAYLINNNTYILNMNLEKKKIECISHLNLGPIKPNWMNLDNCKCKGIIVHNLAISPFDNTVIAVCPVAENRVFWTWFTDGNDFSPLLFFETLTPPDEGTGLVLADYHAIKKGTVLIDTNELEVPNMCID